MWLSSAAAGYTCTRKFDSGEYRKEKQKGKPVSSPLTDWTFQRKETKVKDVITHWILQLKII